MKGAPIYLNFPRTNIISGLQRLIKGFKNLSQLFESYKDGDEDEEIQEIEIGFPTDVQHLAHIGLDGSNNFGTDVLDAPQDMFSTSPIYIGQFGLVMTSQKIM
ncbi:ROP-interactive CRIB motif protein [Rhynchospora pubera]|uniref:ROP-interactive CRIB motif protein n=1 Tax=Rhynchospora pubera TaxID=906938 RepID=A0AAV8FPU8_9POAL|nr:ROP-interactive CRIB motif protein [Rhynchospora pubera]